MSIVKIDANLPNHPKVANLPEEAKLSYLFSILYCHRELTDGEMSADDVDEILISAGVLSKLDRDFVTEELVRARLWERDDDETLWVHDYLDYNPSRAAVLARREYESERDYWDRIRPTIAPMVYERDRYICTYCGATSDLTIDHIIPIAQGGGHDIDNLTTACRSCNSAKGARVPDEWRIEVN